MTESSAIHLPICPNCGHVGTHIGAANGKVQVVACNCGYQAPGVAVAGTVTPPEKMRELQQYADKATEDLRMELKGAQNVNDYLNRQNIDIAREIGELRKRNELLSGELERVIRERDKAEADLECSKVSILALRTEIVNIKQMWKDTIEQSKKAEAVARAGNGLFQFGLRHDDDCAAKHDGECTCGLSIYTSEFIKAWEAWQG